MPTQVENGKAFEYAIAKAYYDFLKPKIRVWLQENDALTYAKHCFLIQDESNQRGFYVAAEKTIETLIAIEPGLVAAKNDGDFLNIRLAADSEGIIGDVRDVIFSRPNSSTWEIGISAKNNHDAVKHSRLSPFINFGEEWMEFSCSPSYFLTSTMIHPSRACVKASPSISGLSFSC